MPRDHPDEASRGGHSHPEVGGGGHSQVRPTTLLGSPAKHCRSELAGACGPLDRAASPAPISPRTPEREGPGHSYGRENEGSRRAVPQVPLWRRALYLASRTCPRATHPDCGGRRRGEGRAGLHRGGRPSSGGRSSSCAQIIERPREHCADRPRHLSPALRHGGFLGLQEERGCPGWQAGPFHPTGLSAPVNGLAVSCPSTWAPIRSRPAHLDQRALSPQHVPPCPAADTPSPTSRVHDRKPWSRSTCAGRRRGLTLPEDHRHEGPSMRAARSWPRR